MTELIIQIGKALSDPARVRALAALDGRELCLCQLIELLELSPSTVSRHMAILHRSCLVEKRKAGRWQYFRLAEAGADDTARLALDWVLGSVRRTRQSATEQKRLAAVLATDPEALCACYRR